MLEIHRRPIFSRKGVEHKTWKFLNKKQAQNFSSILKSRLFRKWLTSEFLPQVHPASNYWPDYVSNFGVHFMYKCAEKSAFYAPTRFQNMPQNRGGVKPRKSVSKVIPDPKMGEFCARFLSDVNFNFYAQSWFQNPSKSLLEFRVWIIQCTIQITREIIING